MTSDDAVQSSWAKWVASAQHPPSLPTNSSQLTNQRQISNTPNSRVNGFNQRQHHDPRVSTNVSTRFSSAISSVNKETGIHSTTFTNKSRQKKSITGQGKPQIVDSLQGRIKNLETEIANLRIDCNVMQKEVSRSATWKQMNELLDQELIEYKEEVATYQFYNERTQRLQSSRSSSRSSMSNQSDNDISSLLLNRIYELQIETKNLQERLETTLRFKKNSDQERQIWANKLIALNSEWEKLKERVCFHSSREPTSGKNLKQLDSRVKEVRSQTHYLKEHLDSLEIKLKAYKDESKVHENKKLMYINQVIKLRQLQQQIRQMNASNIRDKSKSEKLSKEDLKRLAITVKHEKEAIDSLKKQIEDLKEDLKMRNLVVESLKDSKFITALTKGSLELEQYEKFCGEYYSSVKKNNSEKLKQLGEEIKKVGEKRSKLLKQIGLLETSTGSIDKQSLMEIICTKRKLEMEAEKLDQLKPKYDKEMKRYQDELSSFKQEELTIRNFEKDKEDIENRISNTDASIKELQLIKKELKQLLGQLESTYNRLMNELEEKNRENGDYATGLEAKNVREIMTLRDDCNKLHDSIMKRISSKTEDI